MKDLSGQRFGRWTVLKFIEKTSNGYYWLCRCECGKEKRVIALSLRNGKSVSCGCYRSQRVSQIMTKHGSYKSPEYAAWAHMVDRCRNPRNKSFADYGGRGITVCEQWLDAANFLLDMGQRPSPRHSLERIDNTLGYSPDNCKWATPPEQQNNIGISETNIWNRLHDGWTTKETLSIPVSKDKAGWEARRLRQQ